MTLVTAAAGAGKTHTLVRRLERLMESEVLGAHEVLVLTFSRSAVRELQNRIARHGEAARHVRTQTFDSWALDLLMRVDAGQDWANRSFEDRIRGACSAIEDGLADEPYEELRHVVIDEVQDLVAERRELVETLLERFDCGFTVVGDPAQAIYGFQVEDPKERAAETNRFSDWLRATFGEDLIELRLTENFRAGTEEARLALPYGPVLRGRAEQGRRGDGGVYEDLRAALRDALIVGDLGDEHMRDTLASYEGSTAILCRDNGQALLVSEQLHTIGIAHRLQHAAQDRIVPSWLADLFRGVREKTLTRETFDAMAAEQAPDGLKAAGVLWSALRRVAASPGRRTLDLDRLVTAIATDRLPDEITAAPSSPLIVSSFHRAKGLEFDRVIVVDPGPFTPDREEEAAEESRILYVAMTRARSELLRMDTINRWNVRRDQRTRRWVRYGRRAWQRLGLEMTGADVHGDHPAGAVEFAADPLELQEHLLTKVSVADQVVLRRLYADSLEQEQSPPYLILHDDRPIGVASERFRRDLYRVLQQSKRFVPRRFPYEITGVRIEAIETVVGSRAAGTIAGLGDRGVWVAPRVGGLGRFDYGAGKGDE
ncbi:ATP-dependent helicase [Actinomadura logoneensis]|uniref:DNA 3'-5' helicase n=2 Tax=Actinomadura logoneensis TaxID=2293572 RepID=A0A372JSM8_9ACTN|nr:ATP-dependent helicase [Actinomadura logoneensis]